MQLTREKEKELYNSKIEFFTNIAHEIRTPLSLIIGPLDHLMKTTEINNKYGDYLSIIEHNYKRLYTLVNQLLDFRKVDSGVLKFAYHKYNLKELIKKTYTVFELSVKQKNLQIDTSGIAENDEIITDEESFIKIMSNLISNAIKYAQKTIIISAGKQNNNLLITVTDDGPGIEENEKKKIFEAFYQIRRNRNSDSQMLSSQCKGAVAVGEYFIALNYYVIQEFGSDWFIRLDDVITSRACTKQRTIKDAIYKAFKQFIYGVNQPAGNRSYQSPFTNVSYYDHTYFDSLFGEFYYPDGTKPQWEAIDCLQRLFMKFFNKLRTKQILTFPVETMAMVYDPKTNDIIDKDYKDFTAEMYAEGHSFFTYISDSADSLASCCRLRNELAENTFNPTSGLTGVMTGSCNVITLNINRIVQDCNKAYGLKRNGGWKENTSFLRDYLVDILQRVYKYHIAFKTMLYELEDKGMLAASNGGYIHISKLYSTIGINGLNEAARFLGMTVGNNKEYIEFLQLVLGTIKEQNKAHSIHDANRPFLFNSEVVPAEGLGGKNYNWDKEDGYKVPEDENLYNSYFYDAHDDTSVLDKFILHGRQTYQFTDGGSAAHINLEDHLSKEQYLKLIDFAIANGTNYFTFNIPNSKCDDCGYITKHPITECPKCHSKNITQYTRVIGYLRPIKSFGKDRQIEANKRVYSKGV